MNSQAYYYTDSVYVLQAGTEGILVPRERQTLGQNFHVHPTNWNSIKSLQEVLKVGLQNYAN